MTKRCMKIHVKSNSAIESAFPLYMRNDTLSRGFIITQREKGSKLMGRQRCAGKCPSATRFEDGLLTNSLSCSSRFERMDMA